MLTIKRFFSFLQPLALLQYLWDLIRRQGSRKKPEQGSIVHEKWHTRFGPLKKNRFELGDHTDYSANIIKEGLLLTLKKEHLFAWVLNPLYRYKDAVFDFKVSFKNEDVYSSAGLLFRYINEENFYYFLFSTHGYYRFDVVFNGNPRSLLPWTHCGSVYQDHKQSEKADNNHDQYNIRIISRGNYFAFFINDVWIGEIEDDTIEAGYIACGSQNYGEAPQSESILHEISIESRPLEVTVLYYRWSKFIKADPRQRVELAKRLLGHNQYGPALVQLKRAFSGYSPSPDERFLLMETFLGLGLYASALVEADALLHNNPHRIQVVMEKANILYLQNKFLLCRDYLRDYLSNSAFYTEKDLPVFTEGFETGINHETAPEKLQEFPQLWNLYGNAEYALGNYESAVENYARAVIMEPEMPLFALNAGRALEMMKKPEQALTYYLKAGVGFFRQEDYQDLEPLLRRIFSIDPENMEALILRGKMIFHQGDLHKANSIFKRLIKRGCKDSAILFLQGIIHNQEGNIKKAVSLFKQAVDQEPEYPLYRFRYAEALYSAGKPWKHEAHKAYELGPDDGWIRNLAGLAAMEDENYETATLHFAAAYAELPQEPDISINYAEALARNSKIDQGLQVLDDTLENLGAGNRLKHAEKDGTGKKDIARLYNHRGTLLTKIKRFEDADNAYQQALLYDPRNRLYLENRAAVLLDLERVSEAEELLAKALDGNSTPGLYRMISWVACKKGEFKRGETALQQGLSLLTKGHEEWTPQSHPGFLNEKKQLSIDLARLLFKQARYAEAMEHAVSAFKAITDLNVITNNRLTNEPAGVSVLEQEISEIESFIMQIRKKIEDRFLCSLCNREWWVPKNIDRQPSLCLKGEPSDESPAGKCPDCKNIYCVACVKESIKNNRFMCTECDKPLKLSGNALKYLVLYYNDLLDQI